MKRRNIFELASEYDAADDLFRIKRLLERERSIPQYLCDKTVSLSVYEYVKFTLFKQWKNRGRFIDLTDFLDTINYNELWERALVNPEYYLTCIEIAYNMWYMVARKHSDLHPSEISENFLLLRKNMDDCLAHYNHKAVYSEEKEQLIVIEDKPEATAVAEIVEPELALSVLRYNHYLLKGDLTAKKQILVALGNDLEPKRPQLEALNKNLKDIFYAEQLEP